MIYQMLNFFKRIASFYPEIILRPLFALEIQKNTSLLIYNSLRQKTYFLTFLLTVTEIN